MPTFDPDNGLVRILRATSDPDLLKIFDHLFETYQDVGDGPGKPIERVLARVLSIEADMAALGGAPLLETLWPDLVPDVYLATKSQAIFHSQIDEPVSIVCVLEAFFGGQEHRAQCSEWRANC